MRHVILGCGDIGRRIVQQLQADGIANQHIIAYVNSESSFAKASELGLMPRYFELDRESASDLNFVEDLGDSYAYYTVAPQKSGLQDLRSRCLIRHLERLEAVPAKLVLISTTGVYGDAQGQWIDETHDVNPSTDRAKRRYDAESQWQAFMRAYDRVLCVLRVPGIYARSRLPHDRIKKAIPVVRSQEVGYTNRIHADDLAAICVRVHKRVTTSKVLNATDGRPGTITQFLQAVAVFLGEPKLPEISLKQAQSELSEGMLSYLSESRKISNSQLLETLDYTLLYANFRDGMKV